MKIVLVLALSAIVSSSIAQTAKPLQNALTVSRFEGTSVVTDLGEDVKLNRASTLKREWFVLNDPSAPLKIKGDAGVLIQYRSGGASRSGQFQYMASTEVIPSEPISAYELRMHVFDVFGRHVKTLSTVDIGDTQQTKVDNSVWRILSENEASEAFSSLIYVAQVRTAAGRVYSVDRSAVFEHLRRISSRITEAELEPTKR
ncbi:hypothetical protein [Ideonella sp. A 288]|uniref:hypothetical protein n=1 Tax=Ideonella sp. A 288 TaxID=1962181 RepID=UPI001185954C|nr:hypothetical protein [Ideonella sp. A 288]